MEAVAITWPSALLNDGRQHDKSHRVVLFRNVTFLWRPVRLFQQYINCVEPDTLSAASNCPTRLHSTYMLHAKEGLLGVRSPRRIARLAEKRSRVAEVVDLASCWLKWLGDVHSSGESPGGGGYPRARTRPCNHLDLECRRLHDGFIVIEWCPWEAGPAVGDITCASPRSRAKSWVRSDPKTCLPACIQLLKARVNQTL